MTAVTSGPLRVFQRVKSITYWKVAIPILAIIRAGVQVPLRTTSAAAAESNQGNGFGALGGRSRMESTSSTRFRAVIVFAYLGSEQATSAAGERQEPAAEALPWR